MIPWTGEQQRLLQAMGYVLYAQAPPPSLPAMPASASTTPDFGRLLRSLQLASLGRDVSALVDDIATLRGDADAKRALWPKLRALRRAGNTSGIAGRMPEAPAAT